MHNEKDDEIQQGLIPVISKLIFVIVLLVIGTRAMIVVFYNGSQSDNPVDKTNAADVASTEIKKDNSAY